MYVFKFRDECVSNHLWVISENGYCVFPCHDDGIKWKHFHVTGHLWGEFTGHRWIPAQRPWRGALMFSWICAWINGWVNNGEADDSRRHRAHYDVTVMDSIDWQNRFDTFWRAWELVYMWSRHLWMETAVPKSFGSSAQALNQRKPNNSLKYCTHRYGGEGCPVCFGSVLLPK